MAAATTPVTAIPSRLFRFSKLHHPLSTCRRDLQLAFVFGLVFAG